jgi:putative sterol carrier protein
MSYFRSQDEMYAVQRAFFNRVASNPTIGPALQKTNLVIRFKLHDPEGLITIDCRGPEAQGRFFSTVFGESDLRPDLTLLSSADISHEFWLGRVNIVTALVSGKARAEGDISQAMKIMPVLKPMIDIYFQVLKESDRLDLIPK